MTVPTSRYTSLLIPTRIFTYLGLERLAVLYARRVNKRNGHRVLETPEWWHGELERTGLTIEKSISYFGTREAACWSILTMRPFQVCATLRYVPRLIQRIAVAFTEWIIRNAPRSRNADERSCGYVLFVARKLNGEDAKAIPCEESCLPLGHG